MSGTLVKLGEVVDYQTGHPFKSKEYVDEGIRLLRGDNIGQGFLRWDGAKFWPEETSDKIKAFYLEPGDVVLAMDRPWIEAGLKYSVVLPSDIPSLLVQRVSRLRGTPALDGGFLRYLIGSQEFTNYILDITTGTAVPHISGRDILAYEFELPALERQRAIASILGALDDKIELNRRMSATLEEMARSLYRSWFVDFDPVHAKMEGRQPAFMDEATAALFPDRFGGDGLPEGWRFTTIGDVAEIVGGATPKSNEPAFWDGGEHLWATPKDLSNLGQPILLDTGRKITEAGLSKISSRLSPAGTLLLSSRAPIGYLALTAKPLAVNQGFIAIRETNLITGIEAYFWCNENMDLIHANANGSTFQEISKKNFRPMEYILASEAIRHAFKDVSSPMFERITKFCEENLTLASLRDSLLPKLMSGEIRVGEAREQVEEVA